nr:DUF3833 family protein [Aliamphritea spongicola]
MPCHWTAIKIIPPPGDDTFFSGQLKATGVVEDYRGKVIRRFSADINGYWQGNQGCWMSVFILLTVRCRTVAGS